MRGLILFFVSLNAELFSVRSNNPQSVLINADWQVWNSMDCCSDSGALQRGHGTSTVFCFPHLKCGHGDNCNLVVVGTLHLQ